MTDLTKEAFDKALGKLATKEDLKGLVTKKDLDERLTGLATKHDLEEQTDTIGRMINKAFQEHQDRYLEERFDRLETQASLVTQVNTLQMDFNNLEKEVRKLKATIKQSPA